MNKNKIISKIKSSLPYTIIISIICCIATWIRLKPIESVFRNGLVIFDGNDPWYHMRTLNFFIENFPNRMFFNPMTNYPNGSYIHFGALFDYMLASLIFIVGGSNPSVETIDTVSAYFPVILGTLTVIPVYFIGKHLGGRKTGIISALLIAIASGQYLSRSVIGFTDHHVAESLFSTLFMLFFMLALTTAKENNLHFKDIINKNINVIKMPLIYSILAGLMYSAYQLCWIGALLFLFIIIVYAVIQSVSNVLHNENSDYLYFTGIISTFTSAIFVMPFIHFDIGFSMYYYSCFHILVIIGAIFGFIALNFIENEFKKRNLKTYYYPLGLLAIAIGSLIIIKILSPFAYLLITSAPYKIFGSTTGGATTIGEASSIFYNGGVFTFKKVISNFTLFGFLISILGIIVFTLKSIVKPKPKELLVLVWSVLILYAIYNQNRFAYYYSINVALLCGFVYSFILDKLKFNELEKEFKTNVKSINGIPNFLKNIKIEHYLVLIAIIVTLVIPSYNSAIEFTSYPSGLNDAWLESVTWLNDSTPEDGMEYNAIYEAPENGELFNYPETAYGVLSWWDYGHWIETIGHRMPNANPFQQGIGGRRVNITDENVAGASTFFTAQSEEEATNILETIHPDLNKSGARYIISDVEMATSKFYAMTAWTLDTEGYYQQYQVGDEYQLLPSTRYFNSMEARLHLLDGNGLKQYRLVHESESYSTQEMQYKYIYNYFNGENISIINTGYVKIFEYVKGAKISGKISPNETIKISTTIKTGQNRTFEYSQITNADENGRYEFVVPYSTEGSIEGETQFDVMPISPYIIEYNDVIKTVTVDEVSVLKGKEIKIS